MTAMAMLLFLYINWQGKHCHGSASGITLEIGFEVLTQLVRQGNQLLHVQWKDRACEPLPLPVEAFDGESMKEPLAALQQEWEQILLQP